MPRRHPMFLLAAVAVLALALALGACSDDDNPTTPPGDTTAPEVLGTAPEPADVGVAVGDSVYILFSEAMDQDSAAGNVTMSAGTVTGSVWYSDRLLVVAHADWDPGIEVTVTVGTGLTDVAGNALAAAHAFSFWTETTDLLLLATSPADGAVGVNRDAPILLTFSQDVNEASLSSHVAITDQLVKTDYDYGVDRVDEGRYLLHPQLTLPANTTIYVVVNAGLAAQSGGATLQDQVIADFTTGSDVDTTPPTVVSTTPASGANAVAPDQGFFRMTFSEPMDTDSVEPSEWNWELYVIIELTGIPPFWTENNTVLTVPLPDDLPAGLPMELTFVGFRDLAGNPQPTPYTWTARVQGAADYYPVADGARYVREVETAWGTVGDWTPDGTDSYTDWLQQETVDADDFRWVGYQTGGFTTPTGDWESYRKTGSALQWTGFQDAAVKARGALGRLAEKAETFDSPLTILPLPIAVGSWTDNTTVTITGEGTFAAALDGEVLGRVDYVIPQSGGGVFLKDAWKVVRVLEISFEGSPAFTQTDTVWYSATQGEMHGHGTGIDHLADEWHIEDSWQFPAIFTKKGGW